MNESKNLKSVEICATSPIEMELIEDIIVKVTGDRSRYGHLKYDPSSSRLSQLPWKYSWPDADAGELKEVRRLLKKENIAFQIVEID